MFWSEQPRIHNIFYIKSMVNITCMVPIVFSNVSCRSPLVLVSQAVHRAVKRSPVPTNAAGNLGILTCNKGFLKSNARYPQHLTLTTVLLPLESSLLAMPRRNSSLPSSVLESITVAGPLLCSRSITSLASASLDIFLSVSSSASNWFGRHTSARGRISDL